MKFGKDFRDEWQNEGMLQGSLSFNERCVFRLWDIIIIIIIIIGSSSSSSIVFL